MRPSLNEHAGFGQIIPAPKSCTSVASFPSSSWGSFLNCSASQASVCSSKPWLTSPPPCPPVFPRRSLSGSKFRRFLAGLPARRPQRRPSNRRRIAEVTRCGSKVPLFARLFERCNNLPLNPQFEGAGQRRLRRLGRRVAKDAFDFKAIPCQIVVVLRKIEVNGATAPAVQPAI